VGVLAGVDAFLLAGIRLSELRDLPPGVTGDTSAEASVLARARGGVAAAPADGVVEGREDADAEAIGVDTPLTDLSSAADGVKVRAGVDAPEGVEIGVDEESEISYSDGVSEADGEEDDEEEDDDKDNGDDTIGEKEDTVDDEVDKDRLVTPTAFNIIVGSKSIPAFLRMRTIS
jgi:hypothetical protein